MLRKISFLFIVAALVFASFGSAFAAGLINKIYKSPEAAARGAAAWRMSTNDALRQQHGVFTTKRVKVVGDSTLTPTGQQRFTVATRKSLPGTTTPLAEVLVTVKKTKVGWRAYQPGKTSLTINDVAPEGWTVVGRETWIETYGAEGDHRVLPNGDIAIPRDDMRRVGGETGRE